MGDDHLPYFYNTILSAAKLVIREGHTGPYSMGESLAGILAAGDAKALKEMGWDFDDAIDRVGREWCKAVFSHRMTRELWAYKLSLLGSSCD